MSRRCFFTRVIVARPSGKARVETHTFNGENCQIRWIQTAALFQDDVIKIKAHPLQWDLRLYSSNNGEYRGWNARRLKYANRRWVKNSETLCPEFPSPEKIKCLDCIIFIDLIIATVDLHKGIESGKVQRDARRRGKPAKGQTALGEKLGKARLKHYRSKVHQCEHVHRIELSRWTRKLNRI